MNYLVMADNGDGTVTLVSSDPCLYLTDNGNGTVTISDGTQ